MKNNYKDLSREQLLSEVERLRKEIKKSKKYGLVWEQKSEDVVEQCKEELPILVEVKDKEINTDPQNPVNLLIEGDNFHTLSVLNYTHKGKIDVIYIDPPYNRGSNDFIYNDRYVDKEDPFRHSKWISFIHKRLVLSRDLLSENGVIFISIDDNEYANLKLLCDTVFGENNGIGPFIQNKLNAKNDTLNIQKNHEYILVYRRNEIKRGGKTVPTLLNKKTSVKEVFKENDKFYYISDPITTRGEGGTLSARKNLGYTIYLNPNTGDFKGVIDYDLELARTSNSEQEVYTTDKNLIKEGYVAIRPPQVRGKLGAWTWDCDRFNKNTHEIYIKKTKTGYSVNKKIFVDPSEVYEIDGKYFLNTNMAGNSKSIIEFSTNEGTDTLNQILEPGSFNNPKNVEMLKYLISLYYKEDSIVLDYFAGSGTTAQAVLELNQSDDGKRTFILGTNNENGIAQDICYPRIRNVIKGYSKVKGIPANLKYFKTGFVSKSKVSDDTRRELVKRSTEMICVKENTFENVLDKKEFKIFKDANHTTGILFDLDEIKSFKESLKEQNLPTSIYVFSLTKDTFNEDFEDLGLKHELCPIPESILEVYKKLFR